MVPPQHLIEKKRDGLALTEAEIRTFVDGFTAGEIPDYQASAFAMAVFFRGMDRAETVALTRAMMESGRVLDRSSGDGGPRVDKHSTGGIGDKVSIALAPIAAACGLRVPMISGRGLGITGGTLDKLESIPGYRTDLSIEEFERVVDGVGCSIIGQTDDLAPADRRLYALRDVTGTVPSIPLITASILSKKLAEGLDALVLDVKCGLGAFMKTEADARALAASLCEVAAGAGCPTRAIVTAMDQPIGRTAGNALEIAEAVDLLRGDDVPADFRDLVLRLAAEMLLAGRLEEDLHAALDRATAVLDDGRALEVFRRMVEAHGGDPAVADDPRGALPRAPVVEPFPAAAGGAIESVDAEFVGRACVGLGAGRRRTEDRIDPAVGIELLRRAGDVVAVGEPLLRIHARDRVSADEAAATLVNAIAIGNRAPEPAQLVLGAVGEIER